MKFILKKKKKNLLVMVKYIYFINMFIFQKKLKDNNSTTIFSIFSNIKNQQPNNLITIIFLLCAIFLFLSFQVVSLSSRISHLEQILTEFIQNYSNQIKSNS